MEGYDDTSTINGQSFRPVNQFMYNSYFGAVVELRFKANQNAPTRLSATR